MDIYLANSQHATDFEYCDEETKNVVGIMAVGLSNKNDL